MTVDVIDPPGAAAGSPGPSRARGFFGEPPALGFLALTEAWERFSYYGMTAILVLYMNQALFLPGRIEGIAGFHAFRALLEAVFGHMSTLALASQIFGLYTGFVYFTPVFGGWVADRLLGRRRAVMLGALLMSGGHAAMAFDASFLLALALLVVGCGLLKGNISAQVGTLYPAADVGGRTRGFAIFSMAINSGAIAGPLLIGYLADRHGWHLGFGLAGVLMLIGLVTYRIGYRHLPDKRATRERTAAAPPLDARDRKVIAALMAVMAITVFQSVAYYQNSNIGLVWIDAHVDLDLLGFRVPVGWFNAIDPAASILFVPPLFALWRWQARRRRDRDEIVLIAEGAWIMAAANLLLAFGALGGGRVSVLCPLAYEVLLGIAFLYYWPTLLALVSRAAPARVNATMMGTAFLSLFVGNMVIGWLGRFYERMTPAGFWTLHAGIAATGAVLAMLLRRPLARLLAERGSAPQA